MPTGDARALWHAKVPRLQLQNKGAVKKMPSRETVLPRLAHYLTSNLQVPLSCHQGSTVVRAPLKGRCRRSAVAGSPPKVGFTASHYIIHHFQMAGRKV